MEKRQRLARDLQHEQRLARGQRDRIRSPLQPARRARDRQRQCLHGSAGSHECPQEHLRIVLEEAPLEYRQARRQQCENDKARRREQTPRETPGLLADRPRFRHGHNDTAFAFVLDSPHSGRAFRSQRCGRCSTANHGEPSPDRDLRARSAPQRHVARHARPAPPRCAARAGRAPDAAESGQPPRVLRASAADRPQRRDPLASRRLLAHTPGLSRWMGGLALYSTSSETVRASCSTRTSDPPPSGAGRIPRTCLTLPFWAPLLPETRCIICLRNPLDVARSLEERDGFPLERGVRLWVDYLGSALLHSAGLPRMFVAFDDLVERPESELARIAAFVGPTPAAPNGGAQATGPLTDATLRHHHTADARRDGRRLARVPGQGALSELAPVSSITSPIAEEADAIDGPRDRRFAAALDRLGAGRPARPGHVSRARRRRGGAAAKPVGARGHGARLGSGGGDTSSGRRRPPRGARAGAKRSRRAPHRARGHPIVARRAAASTTPGSATPSGGWKRSVAG